MKRQDEEETIQRHVHEFDFLADLFYTYITILKDRRGRIGFALHSLSFLRIIFVGVLRLAGCMESPPRKSKSISDRRDSMVALLLYLLAHSIRTLHSETVAIA